MKVKIFDESHEDDLTDDINKFIKEEKKTQKKPASCEADL